MRKNFMQEFHDKLMEKGGAYAKWHNNPSHQLFQWLLLLVVVGGVGWVLINRTSEPEAEPYGLVSSAHERAQSENIKGLSAQLLSAIKNYNAAKGTGNQARSQEALAKVAQLAEERKARLLEVIKTNPGLASLELFPPGLLKQFPEEVQAFLEYEVETEGELQVSYLDYFEEDRAEIVFELETENEPGKPYRLYFASAEAAPLVNSGTKLKVKGTKIDENIVIAEAGGSGGGTEILEPVAAGSTGEQRVLAMLVNFTNNSTSQPWTQAQVADKLFNAANSTNAYYQEVSFGATSFSGDVTPWLTIPYTSENCSTIYQTWANAADSLAQSRGYDVSSYDRKLYVMTGGTACGWAGISYVNGTAPNYNRTWTNGYNDNRLYDHELGHSLGMWHASTIRCGTKAIDVYTSCSGSEYGDLYDTMGSWNAFHVNGAHKAQLTFVPTSRVHTVTASGAYSIAPLETAGTSMTQVLKIYKPNTNSYYYLDYRRPIGADSGLPAGVTNGASIVIHPSGTFSGVTRSGNTARVDATPADALSNSALLDGASFVDEINGITITQLFHTETSTRVQVDFGPGVCGKAKPTLTISPTSKTGVAGQGLSYNISAKNNDSTNCPPNTYSVSVSGFPTGFTYSASNFSLAPGGSGIFPLTVTSPLGQVDGSYTFTVRVTNTSDTAYYNTAQATYLVFTDNASPTVNITSPANGATLKGSNATVNVSATDDVGVTLTELYADGAKLTSSNSGSLSYRWSIRNLSKGAHTLEARAYDAVGHMSSKTITVNK